MQESDFNLEELASECSFKVDLANDEKVATDTYDSQDWLSYNELYKGADTFYVVHIHYEKFNENDSYADITALTNEEAAKWLTQNIVAEGRPALIYNNFCSELIYAAIEAYKEHIKFWGNDEGGIDENN